VQFTLLYQTILFLAREPYRKASARTGETSPASKWYYGFIATTCLLVWQDFNDPGQFQCLFLIVLACLLELATEEEYLHLQKVGEIHRSVKFFALSAVAKTIFSVGVVYLLPIERHTLGLSASFVAGSLVYFLLMKIKITHPPPPTLSNSSGNSTTFWFTIQCFEKQLLTEAEKYIMTFLPVLTLSEQGVFDIVSSLAALPARFLFQPIEEAIFQYFSKTKKGETAAFALGTGLRIVVGISIVMIAFGRFLAKTVLFLYAGDDRLVSGAELLVHLCYYQIFIAVNGVTEAYANAYMSEKSIKYHNVIYVFSSIAVCATVFYGFGAGLGTKSFVLGNMASMAVRIVWNFYIIGADFPLLAVLAPVGVLIAALSLLFYEYQSSSVWTAVLEFGATRNLSLSRKLIELGAGAVAAGLYLALYLGVVLLLAYRGWKQLKMKTQ